MIFVFNMDLEERDSSGEVPHEQFQLIFQPPNAISCKSHLGLRPLEAATVEKPKKISTDV